MIDSEVQRLAQKRIAPEMEERRRLLPRRILGITEDMARRGFGSSSAQKEGVQEACEREAAERVVLSWAEIKTVLAAVGVQFTEELAGDLKTEVALHVHSGDLIEIVKKAGGDDQRLRGALGRALQKTGSDIDLYTVNLKRVAEQQGRAGQPIVNFHGPVGAVQTGPYATATVVQRFGGADRELLGRVLAELRSYVETLEASTMPQKAELVELIDEARTEVTKVQPSGLRLTSMLYGIGGTIQTVGAMPAAYAALKTAAAAVGITLP